MGNAFPLTSSYQVYRKLLRVYCLLIDLVLVFYQYLSLFSWPARQNVTHQSVKPDDVLIQFGPPDDEHLLLETCRGMK
jgi:hypothetical protein